LAPTARTSIRRLARAAALATFALAVLLPGGASARQSAAHAGGHPHASCPAPKRSTHRSRHASKHAACTGRHARKRATPKSKKTTHGPSAPATELVPAACEDGTLPSHEAGGGYSCEDGSTPACEEGTLQPGAAGAAPLCAIKKGADEPRCSGECGVEFSCEDASAGAPSRNCERAGEGEAPEHEEEE
jgi:hypothetical protein